MSPPKGNKSYAQAAAENPPPPYSGPSHQHPQGQAAAQQELYRPSAQQQQATFASSRRPQQTVPLLGAPAGGLVIVVTPRQLALARARRRFFGALFWALLVYLIAGVLFGDYHLQNSRQRHRRPRDGFDGDAFGRTQHPEADAAAQVVDVPIVAFE